MGKHKRYLLLCTVVLVAAAAVFTYVKGKSVNSGTRRIIYLPKTVDDSNDFWTQLLQGVRMAADEYNMEVTVVAPDSEVDVNKQNELILWAINEQPDAILLSPCNYVETLEYAKQVKEHGIPLILIDSAMEETIEESVVATDNISLGEVQGSYMREFVKENSKIAIVGHVKDSSTAIDREAGVRKGLGEDAGRIVDVVFCDSDYDKAYDLMVRLMKEHPDIDLVSGLNEYSAVGAARAIKDLNLQNQVCVFGTDSSLEEVQLLEEGIFQGIVIQNPFKMGYMGVEVAARLLNGETVLHNIDSGCELITRQNAYTEENQKLLFPFREE